jgi:ssDNA-binding Zn-finger/Zn-ribbon topoisomerase 1
MTTPKKPIDFTRLESCPKCEKSWQGKPIPQESRELYGGAEWFSKVIGISSRQQDRIVAWQCPECHACWDRDTSRPRESFDLTSARKTT